MDFLELPHTPRSPSQTNFIIEEDARSDISDYPGGNGNSSSNGRSLRSIPLCIKVLIIGMCLGILVLALLSSTFGYLYVENIPSSNICKTQQCTKTATMFIKSMDETTDPCEDFHKFSCGNWITDTAAIVSVAVYDHTTIMRDRIVGRLRSLTENITNEDIEILQQIRIMYNSCVDLASIENAGLQPLIDLLLDLIRPNDTIAHVLGRIHRRTGQDYMFDLSLEQNFQNTSIYVLAVDQPELPVVKANFLYSRSIIEAYEKLIMEVLERLEEEPGFSTLPVGNRSEDARSISAFERLFALSMSDESGGKAGTSNLMSLRDLNQLFLRDESHQINSTGNSTNVTRSPSWKLQQLSFNWTEYVVTLFDGISDVEINEDFLINVNDIQYIYKISKFFQKIDPKDFKLYLTWELLYTFGKDVTKEVRNYFNTFSSIAEGSETTPNRHTECILLLDQSLPFALTHKYILKYLKQSTITEAKQMFRYIVKAFKSLVASLDWMGTSTKIRAFQKVNMVEAFIGFPRWLSDPKAVDEYYKGLRFTNNSFFKNMLIMLSWIAERALKGYTGPVDRTWVSDSPAEADAFYDDEMNAITFPAGFLQEPFIGMGLKAIDYGALGSVVGHELTHGFDTMGRYSDGYGRLDSWWTLDTLKQFVAKTQCFVNQYEKFWLPELSPVPGPNNTVDGSRTLAENIADNGGIREAFQAYKYLIADQGKSEPRLPGLEKYTPEQIFFLSFAQSWCSYLSPVAMTDMVETNVHSPPKFRIIGPLQNFPEFSTAWKCPVGSPMNPVNKCVLWG